MEFNVTKTNIYRAANDKKYLNNVLIIKNRSNWFGFIFFNILIALLNIFKSISLQNNVRTGLMTWNRHVINNNYSDQLYYSRVMLVMICDEDHVRWSIFFAMINCKHCHLIAPIIISHFGVIVVHSVFFYSFIALVFQLFSPGNYPTNSDSNFGVLLRRKL